MSIQTSCISKTACFENILLATLQNTKLEEAVDGNLMGFEVNIVPDHSLFEHVNTDELHLQDDIIDRPALCAKLAVDGKRSCLLLVSCDSLSGWGTLRYQRHSTGILHQHPARDLTFLPKAEHCSRNVM